VPGFFTGVDTMPINDDRREPRTEAGFMLVCIAGFLGFLAYAFMSI
jgi:hypothetical protein